MRGEIHNCALLLYALALFWLYRTHALIFYNKSWKQRLESEVQGLECINSFAAMLFIVNTVYLNDRYREKQSIHQLLKGIYSILRKKWQKIKRQELNFLINQKSMFLPNSWSFTTFYNCVHFFFSQYIFGVTLVFLHFYFNVS